jgi:hypothetical protein
MSEQGERKDYVISMLFQRQSSDVMGVTKVESTLRMWVGPASCEDQAVGLAVADGLKNNKGFSLSMYVVKDLSEKKPD